MKATTSAILANSKHAVNAPGARSVPQIGGSPAHMGAAAFTSARNAQPALQPQPARQAAVATPSKLRPVVRHARYAAVKRASPAHVSDRGAERRAAARRLAAISRPVSLQRDIDIPAQTASVAPSGSIPAMVTAEARRQGVNPALAHAVVKVESRYQPRATGRGGYVGLMQLSYRTAQGMGFRGSRQALYEPSNNLTYGMRYLAQAVRLSAGNTCAAVSKYQGGHGVKGVTRAGAVYCAKVKRFMAEGVPSSGKLASN
ncbi:MAG TPA: lytic transglycosylase domain-containing protein [Hansschlegelia sp.]